MLCDKTNFRKIEPKQGGERHIKTFWITWFRKDGGDADADPPKPPSMSPYWFLRVVHYSGQKIGLQELTFTFESSLAVAVQVPKKEKYPDTLKKAAVATKLTLRIPCLTNLVKVTKGSRLCLANDPIEETAIA